MDSSIGPALIGAVAGCGACIGFPVLLVIAWIIVKKSSGWPKLARHYSATTAPEGQPYTRQSIGVGKAWYMHVATIHIGPGGLRMSLPLKAGDLLIPWQHVTAVVPSVLGSTAHTTPQRAIELVLSGPPDCPVKIGAELLEAIRLYVPAGAIPADFRWE